MLIEIQKTRSLPSGSSQSKSTKNNVYKGASGAGSGDQGVSAVSSGGKVRSATP